MVGRNGEESSLTCGGDKVCKPWPEKCLQVAGRKGASPECNRGQSEAEPAPANAGQVAMIGENLQDAVGSRHWYQELPGDLARTPFRTIMAEKF